MEWLTNFSKSTTKSKFQAQLDIDLLDPNDYDFDNEYSEGFIPLNWDMVSRDLDAYTLKVPRIGRCNFFIFTQKNCGVCEHVVKCLKEIQMSTQNPCPALVYFIRVDIDPEAQALANSMQITGTPSLFLTDKRNKLVSYNDYYRAYFGKDLTRAQDYSTETLYNIWKSAFENNCKIDNINTDGALIQSQNQA